MATLRVWNTYDRAMEAFEPLEAGRVRMYTCGPTVYNFAHIGNFRAYTFEDLLRRTLKYLGFAVTQVMNLTDVDDKTIQGCNAQGVSLDAFTRTFKDAFFANLAQLRIEPAEVYPAATAHIPEMVALIERLQAAGVVYESRGSYYFRIADFPAYGHLSHLDLTQLKAGVRVDNDEYEKDAAQDFALWKAYSPEDGSVFWETKFGRGRPGWHIECSAMSMKYLGESFDLHTGGVDNIFPHHENEIAQSEAATGKRFVKYWMHCEHLLVEGHKMSKSAGNYYTLQQLVEMGHAPRALRFILLGTHYRSQLNFTFDAITGANSALQRVDDFRTNLARLADGPLAEWTTARIASAREAFDAALCDDLNVSPAHAALFDLVRDANVELAEARLTSGDARAIEAWLVDIDRVLGWLERDAEVFAPRVYELIEARKAARKARDFAGADAIRAELLAEGIVLEDTPTGTYPKRPS